MLQPAGNSDGVLLDDEWERLLTETSPRLAALVARLARWHGFRTGGGRLKAVAEIDHDRPEARVRD